MVQQNGPTAQEIEVFVDDKLAVLAEQYKALETQVTNKFTSIDNMMAQHQAQINQLSELSTQGANEVSALYLQHSALQANHIALCDCILDAKLLQVPSMQSRRHVCEGLVNLRLMLTHKRVVQALSRFAGDNGREIVLLTMVSRAFHSMRPAIALSGVDLGRLTSGQGRGEMSECAETKDVPCCEDLDMSAWCNLGDYEPFQSVLEQWKQSVTVHVVLGSYSIEDVLGDTDAVKFKDVYSIFNQLGLTLDEFVEKFTLKRRTRNADDLQEMAGKILSHFASNHTGATDTIKCVDLYRIFEVVGYPLDKFKSIFINHVDLELPEGNRRIGNYTIRRQIGQGRNGMCMYMGEHKTDFTRVAIKWPVADAEVSAFRDIQREAPRDSFGLPHILASGTHEGQRYFVTELLGSPLTKVFDRIEKSPINERWRAICVIGRLLVRRLQSLHDSGHVHNDIAPGNILLGPASSSGRQCGLYIIDFEHTSRYPGGGELHPQYGSAEWSSIRSAEGGERLPEDDLEALGWVLLNGLIGSLPWFDWLAVSYSSWNDSRWCRDQVIKQVKEAKIRILEGDFKSFGWKHSTKLPKELCKFIRMCNEEVVTQGHPNYGSLIELLGGDKELSAQDAECRDLEEFSKLVTSVL